MHGTGGLSRGPRRGQEPRTTINNARLAVKEHRQPRRKSGKGYIAW